MLKGKNAIVTGSTSGIGQVMAETLAREGCNIMINGFGKPDEIEAIRTGIAALGVKAEYSGADVSKGAEIQQMVAQAEKAFGGVDILVNNAGIQFTSPVSDFPEEKWDAILATNLSAAFHAIKHVLPIMRKQKFGRIVNTISVHGLVASSNKSAYVAAKHGMTGLTKTVALETALDGITCNGICPGWVMTPLVDKQIRDKAAKDGLEYEAALHSLVDEKQPTHAFVNPEDLAALVVFLCGPHAGGITGASIPVDGGWTAQ